MTGRVAKRSAGILLWRRGPTGPQVLIAHPGGPLFAGKEDGHWSIPKGEYEVGETALEAAYREFAEESGQAAPPGVVTPLGEADQRGGKVNTMFALEGDLDPATCRSNHFTMVWAGREQQFPEMDRFAWYDLEAARVKLFPSQVVFLDRLAEQVDAD